MEIGIIIRQWGKIIGNRNNNVAVANAFVSSPVMVLVFHLAQWMSTWHVGGSRQICEPDACKPGNAVITNVDWIC